MLAAHAKAQRRQGGWGRCEARRISIAVLVIVLVLVLVIVLSAAVLVLDAGK